MCAVISIWQSFPTHIKVLYDCPYQMKNPPVISIWKSSYGFFIDFFWIHRRRSRIEMPNLMDLLWIPHGHIVAAVWLIWPPALRLIWFDSLSDWYDEMRPHFDMIDDLSYWYDSRIPFGFLTEISPLLSRWNHTDFLRILFRFLMDKAHIDMTRGCLIDMIGCPLSYRDDSYRNDADSRIEMILTLVLIWAPLSYRYDQGKEDFVPSVISQFDSHISCHLYRKVWRSSASFLWSFS